jgi:hypothetical protein
VSVTLTATAQEELEAILAFIAERDGLERALQMADSEPCVPNFLTAAPALRPPTALLRRARLSAVHASQTAR